MRLILRATRVLGGVVASCLLFVLSALLVEGLRRDGFTADFVWRQVLPAYLPYCALLILLLLPFSQIRDRVTWKLLFGLLVVLSLVWLVPVAYHAVVAPAFDVTKPPGEGVAQKIVITRSYRELVPVGLMAGFLCTQMFAIWFARRWNLAANGSLSGLTS